jgi:hypothetical protein
MYVYIYTYISIYNVYVYVYVFVHVCVYVYVYTQTHAQTTHKHTHARTHTLLDPVLGGGGMNTDTLMSEAAACKLRIVADATPIFQIFLLSFYGDIDERGSCRQVDNSRRRYTPPPFF